MEFEQPNERNDSTAGDLLTQANHHNIKTLGETP